MLIWHVCKVKNLEHNFDQKVVRSLEGRPLTQRSACNFVDSFVSLDDSFVGPDDSFVGLDDSFAGPDDSFVGQDGQHKKMENAKTTNVRASSFPPLLRFLPLHSLTA